MAPNTDWLAFKAFLLWFLTFDLSTRNCRNHLPILKSVLGIGLWLAGAKIVFNIQPHPATTFAILAVIFLLSMLLSMRSKS